MTATIELPSVSKKEQQHIVETLPPEIKVSDEGSEERIIKIDGKQVNSIVLDLRVCSGIFRDIETLRSALMSLIQKVLEKGKIDTNVQGVIFVTLTLSNHLSSHEAEVLTGLLTQQMSCIPKIEPEGRSNVDTIDTAMFKMLGVSNIPSDATENALISFFENKKRSGGGDVKKIDYNKENHTAVVTFKDNDVVQRVVDKNPLIFQIKLIEVATCISETIDESQPDDGESSAHHASAIDPDELSDETIAHYFESARNPSNSTTTTIDIARMKGDTFINLNINRDKEMTKMIRVSKIPPDATENALISFFENKKRSGGGDVQKIDYNKENHTAIVTFKDNDVVQQVVYNNPLLFQVKLIYVLTHIPRRMVELQLGTHARAADQEKLSAQTNVRCFDSGRVTTTTINTINIGKFERRKQLVNFLEEDKLKRDTADIPVSLNESQPDDESSPAIYVSDFDKEELYAESIAQYCDTRRVTNINVINIRRIERDAFINISTEKDDCMECSHKDQKIIHLKKVISRKYSLRTHHWPNEGLLEDLDIDKKMWLAVGISLHTIIATELRIYIKTFFSELYKSMVISNQIDTQMYPYNLRVYSNSKLNYEAINNNKVDHGHDIHEYDYTVRNAVDLSKLFLPTSISQYDDFDRECGLSFLIRIITHVDIFPKDVKDIAKEVESNISSKWTCCDFTELDKVKFMSSFVLMEKFVKTLELIANEESTVLNNLNRWKNIVFSPHQLQDRPSDTPYYADS